jgi:hypothetical protein
LNLTISNQGSARLAPDFSKLPDGATVNISAASVGALPRLGKITGFSGTVNFTTEFDLKSSAAGLVDDSLTELGSDDVDFGITGTPATSRILFDLVNNKTTGGDYRFGNIRVPSENASVYLKYSATLTIGALGGRSVFNGKLTTDKSSVVTVNKIGSGVLELGEAFGTTVYGSGEFTARSLNISAGTLENRADLSGWNVAVTGVGVTLKGDLSSVNFTVAPGGSYKLDFPANPVKGTTYVLLKTASNTPNPDFAAEVAVLNEGETKGKWKVSYSGGAWVLRWAKNGLAIILR